MRVAIVQDNGVIIKRVIRTLLNLDIKGDVITKVNQVVLDNYDFIVFTQDNAAPNLAKRIERIVLQKKLIVLFISRNINVGQFYSFLNDSYFHVIGEQTLESELGTTINLAPKFIRIIRSLQVDNDKLKQQIKTLKLTNQAKNILMSKGLSEAKSHTFIQKKAMDLRLSKEQLVNLIIKNKIDI